jgi:hypothetical protein
LSASTSVTTQNFGNGNKRFFLKIPNFGANKNFYFKYKINLLSFWTCEIKHLLPCFK